MNKQPNLVVSIAVIIVFVALIIFAGIWAKKHPSTQSNTQKESLESQLSKITDPVKQIKKEGAGVGAAVGDTVSVSYVGALSNGTVFDTNVQEIAKQVGLDQPGRNYGPFTFKLGSTDVISGWNIGVTGMKKGEVAQVILPAKYAYGEQGVQGVIPPNSTLIFQIEVLDIVSPATTADTTVNNTTAKTGTTTKTVTTPKK